MTYKDKGSYESSPPYIHVLQFYNQVQEHFPQKSH